MILKFIVPGKPIGSARPRVTRYGTYIPKTTQQYKNSVRNAYSKRYFFGDAVYMEVVCYFPIPKSATKKERRLIAENDYLYTKKPDGDNVLKSIKDALNGIAYHDDSCVVYESILRKYAKEGEEPRTEVLMYDTTGGRLNE